MIHVGTKCDCGDPRHGCQKPEYIKETKPIEWSHSPNDEKVVQENESQYA